MTRNTPPSNGLASIDPAEWSAMRSIVTYGVRVGLRANRERVLDKLADHLPPLWKNSSTREVDRVFSFWSGSATHQLFENSELAIRSSSLRTVLEYFGNRLKPLVAEMARRRVFVHAGAVGWDGRAIVIPGRSMSGKTSLVRELIRAGATYYSDEYAVLDLRGRVHPYPQPLAIRSAGSNVQRDHRVEDLGGTVGKNPLPIGLVMVTRFQIDGTWRPRRLTSGQGVLALLDNTVAARRRPEIVVPTLQRAVSEAIVFKSARGAAHEAADRILALLR